MQSPGVEEEGRGDDRDGRQTVRTADVKDSLVCDLHSAPSDYAPAG